jgi:hypothetical protein
MKQIASLRLELSIITAERDDLVSSLRKGDYIWQYDIDRIVTRHVR